METHRTPFSPERAAELHNSLLRKTTAHDDSIPTERTTAARFLAAVPEISEMIPNVEGFPLFRFLSRIETAAESDGRIGPSWRFTPEMYQPDPNIFYSDMFSHEGEYILLYGSTGCDAPEDGGLFLNPHTYKVIWNETPHPFQDANLWLPIEKVFRILLKHWDTGKYFWNTSEECINLRPWTQSDLSEALVAWDGLLSAIESRLPSVEGTRYDRLEPLSLDCMAPFRMSVFARAFLSQASRPKFRHIAPGLATFSAESLRAAYMAEESDSYRQTKDLSCDGTGDWSSLLFPAGRTVPSDLSENSDYRIRAFDSAWGLGKFTVNRHAGLYAYPTQGSADTICMIQPSGSTGTCRFKTRCPWGPSRYPRVAEVLRHWTLLVENGTWMVDEDGIAGDHCWFDEHASRTQLDWRDFLD